VPAVRRGIAGDEGGRVVVETVAAVGEQIVVETVEEFPGREKAPGADSLDEGVEDAVPVACLADAVGVQQKLIARPEGMFVAVVGLSDEHAEVQGR
jgi:hypothetical protein